jgi:acyl-CoA thioesterase
VWIAMADENPMTFEDLMSLQTLDFGEGERGKEQFMSVRPAFCAGGGAGASFGGHVYAQGVWAAAQTVGSGMVVHVSFVTGLVVSLSNLSWRGMGRRGVG